jgi:type IV secretory pathway TrbF-like protein
MTTSSDEQSVISDETWRAWDQKGKLREQATARKIKIIAGLVLALIALGSWIYFLSVR